MICVCADSQDGNHFFELVAVGFARTYWADQHLISQLIYQARLYLTKRHGMMGNNQFQYAGAQKLPIENLYKLDTA
jgi:hypothetical protein